MARIENVNIPYPDFQMGEIIDSEQFDENNGVLVEKINEIVDSLNSFLSPVDGSSGASAILIKPKEPFTSENIQAYFDDIVSRLRSTVIGSSGASLINNIDIDGIVGNDLETQLNQFKSIIDLKINAQDVYTKDELIPFLTGGETSIKVEVFTIVNPDAEDGTFTYTDGVTTYTGELTDEGHRYFTLQLGRYAMNLNRVKAYIDDTLIRSQASGGLLELAPTVFALTESLDTGVEITVEYFERASLTNEYSIIISPVKPPSSGSNTLWLKPKEIGG